MPPDPRLGVGRRIATARRAKHLTQEDLARASDRSLSTIRAIERAARLPSDTTLDAVAAALDLDPARLLQGPGHAKTRIHQAMPALSAAIATYDNPDDGTTRPLHALHTAVEETVNWRIHSQYTQLAEHLPTLIEELCRGLAQTTTAERPTRAALLASACRSADALAYKHGYRDLSARLIDVMRWAAPQTEDPLVAAMVAYVRTETYFAARAHAAGLRALEAAADAAPQPTTSARIAARGSLHMRAAVIAARAGNTTAAATHLAEAHRLSELVRKENVYHGTPFGPASVRIHQVSVAVSLGEPGDALAVATAWKPPREEVPAERRSAFYIELARAQLWAGRPDDAFESLKVARTIAPQHVREHPWAREDTATILRLTERESLMRFVEWMGIV